MADSKSGYSLAAQIFNKITRHSSMRDAISYLKSKLREEKFNEDWKKNMVDLNQIVNQFTPGAKGVVKGYKYEFRKGNYVIKVDMPSGYLRIFDKRLASAIKLDGTPGSDAETHFKVKKRREM